MPDYSLGDVARILKVSPRRLRYWQKTQLLDSARKQAELREAVRADASDEMRELEGLEGEVEISVRQASKDTGYAFRDLVVLRAIASLVDKGIPLQRIRRNLETLRDRLPGLDDPAVALRLWNAESDHLVVRHEGRLEEAEGQLLLDFDLHQEGRQGTKSVASLAEFEAASVVAARAARTAQDAVEWFERGCELDADASKWAEAIEAYETALEIEPDYADAYCNLGAVRYNQGQRSEARRAFESCLSREADHVEANFNLANLLEEEGEDHGALAHYRRALAADPLYPDLHINLALLYEKVGRRRVACDHWRRYLQFDPKGSWSQVARLRLERESDQA